MSPQGDVCATSDDDDEFFEAADHLSRQNSLVSISSAGVSEALGGGENGASSKDGATDAGDVATAGASDDAGSSGGNGLSCSMLERTMVIKDLDSGREFIMDASGAGPNAAASGGDRGDGAGTPTSHLAGHACNASPPASASSYDQEVPSSPDSPVVHDPATGRSLSMNEFAESLGFASPIWREVQQREAAAAAAANGGASGGSAGVGTTGGANGREGKGKKTVKGWMKKRLPSMRDSRPSFPHPSVPTADTAPRHPDRQASERAAAGSGNASKASSRSENGSPYPSHAMSQGTAYPGESPAMPEQAFDAAEHTRAMQTTPESQSGLGPGSAPVRAKVFVHRKHYKEFTDVRLAQELRSHNGAVWCMKFSHGGSHMASAGQDATVRVWATNPRDPAERAAAAAAAEAGADVGAMGQGDAGGAPGGVRKGDRKADGAGSSGGGGVGRDNSTGGAHASPPELSADDRMGASDGSNGAHERYQLFQDKPLRVWRGHKADVLDIAWSSTDFLLSASMDKTVRLWHISMDECLRIFVHNDFVTSVDFNPTDDKFFLSGSLDEKLRLWNIPDHVVTDFVDLHEMITAVAFAPGGDKAVVGSYKGTCRFYRTEDHRFEYVTQIDVRNARAAANAPGKKITGLCFMPGDSQKLLVTSNDSRLRVYDGYTLVCKYKGLQNVNAQIRASFSEEGDFIVCGSEDECTYVWSTVNSFVPSINPIYTGYRKDKHASFECFLAHQHIVSVSIFAPRRFSCVRRPAVLHEEEELEAVAQPPVGTNASKIQGKVINSDAKAAAAAGVAAVAAAAAVGRVIVSAGFGGEIKVFENFGVPTWI